jgi:hypothetical protein
VVVSTSVHLSEEGRPDRLASPSEEQGLLMIMTCGFQTQTRETIGDVTVPPRRHRRRVRSGLAR